MKLILLSLALFFGPLAHADLVCNSDSTPSAQSLRLVTESDGSKALVVTENGASTKHPLTLLSERGQAPRLTFYEYAFTGETTEKLSVVVTPEGYQLPCGRGICSSPTEHVTYSATYRLGSAPQYFDCHVDQTL